MDFWLNFNQKSIDLQFQLVPTVENGPRLPDSCTSQSNLLSWISTLPSTTRLPMSVGLTDNAEDSLDKVGAQEIHDKTHFLMPLGNFGMREKINSGHATSKNKILGEWFRLKVTTG
jgi:hypothetical protein